MKPEKVETSYHERLRTQIVDCLMYMKKPQRKWATRGLIETEIDRSYASMCVGDIIESCKGYDVEKVYVSSVEESIPYEEHTCTYITLNTVQPTPDEQWFDTLAESLCPTDYQMTEYHTYQLLKQKYEGIIHE